MTRSATPATSLFPNLDFLRAVAVLLVYCFHLFLTTGPRMPDFLAQFGVILFFVHTSLVLMFSLERIDLRGQKLSATFYLRRLFRIYPLSVVCVSLIIMFQLPRAPWWPWTQPDVSTILANLLLYTEFAYKPVVTSVLWSLPYEVAMYAVLPFCYLAGKAYGIRGILALWALSLVGGIVQPYISWRLGLAQFAPCFIAGVVCYFMGYGVRRRPLPFFGWPLILLAAAGMQAFGTYYEYEHVSRWVLCLMIGLTAPFFAELNRPLLNKGTELIARYSYGIYLTHLHAQWVALVVLKDQPAAVRYSVLIALSIGLPVALYHMVEAPMIRLGARLAASLSTTSSPVIRPTSIERPLPAPAEAAQYNRVPQSARSRAGLAPASRPTKIAPAPASAR
ncbi:MAG TPA: acyltransferase [Nitrospira sp.]|nr:acyltransferase [Nitrospira sp.]